MKFQGTSMKFLVASHEVSDESSCEVQNPVVGEIFPCKGFKGYMLGRHLSQSGRMLVCFCFPYE